MGLLGVALLGLLLPLPASAHWCNCLWVSRYNIVVRPVVDSIDVPESPAEATLHLWVQNNMGYPLNNFTLVAQAAGYSINESRDDATRPTSFLLPGERLRYTLYISRTSGDDQIDVNEIRFFVTFGGGAQDDDYGNDEGATSSRDIVIKRQDGGLFPGRSTTPRLDSELLGDNINSQARHLLLSARADLHSATADRSTAINSLLNEFCAGRDSWSSDDPGDPVTSLCPSVDGSDDTTCAAASNRDGYTTKWDWQHLWAAGELAYRWSVLSTNQRSALRDRLFCAQNDEVLGMKAFALFVLGYIGDGAFTDDVSGSAGSDASDFLSGVAASGGGTTPEAYLAKAALHLIGEDNESDVRTCLTSGSPFAEVACAAALNIRGNDSGDAAMISDVFPRVSWSEPEEQDPLGLGFFAGHVANLVAWHHRGWQPEGNDEGVVTAYREESVAPPVPGNLRCSLGGTPPVLSIAWNASTAGEAYEVGYRILWGETPGNYVHGSYTLDTIYTPQNLAPNTTYYFTVQAVDDSINASGNAPEISCEVPTEAHAPQAVISCSPTEGDFPLTVTCNCNGSTDQDSNINHCYFSDGGAEEDGFGGTVTFDYDTAGSRTITVRVTDTTGLEDEAQVTISVNDPNNDAPVAVADANVTSGDAPLTVVFDGSSSNDPDGTLVSYDWDFDDSGTSTQIGPTHEFSTAGIYDVSLTVTDDGTPALTGTDTVRITVTSPTGINHPPDCSNATVTPAAGEPPLTVTLDARPCTDPDGDNLSFAWAVAAVWVDQVDLTGDLVEHTMTEEDDYTVTLTATDDGTPSRQVSVVFPIEVRVGAGITTEVDPLVAAGCACREQSGSAAYGWVLLALALLRRRR